MPSTRSIAGTTTSTLSASSTPPGHADQRADDADQRALDDEDRHDRRRRRAERAQDRDVGLLVGDHHHLRRDDVERRDGDDQRQDDEHHALLDLRPRGRSSRADASSRGPRPSTGSVARELARDLRRREQVVELQPHAGHAADAVQPRASSRWISARPLSNSYMPISKMPTTREAAQRAAACPPASPCPAA